MSKKRKTAEQIIRLLRQADVLLGQGMTVSLMCRERGISDASY